VTSVRDSDVSRANEMTDNSTLIIISETEEAASSSSVWTTLDTADQQVGQRLGIHVAGEGRQSLASVGNESSFFRQDMQVPDSHLCSTPSRGDDVDDQVSSRQQSSSPPSDWACTPGTVDFSPVSPLITRDDQDQRSPPVTSVLSGRRHGCLQTPQLTPIMEEDIDDDDDDDDVAEFSLPDNTAAAKLVGVEFNNDDRQAENDAVKSTSHHHTARSDILDLTLVTPVTSPLCARPGSSNSNWMRSRNELSDQVPEWDVTDEHGAEIINGSRFDVDDLTTGEHGKQQNEHESSYSGIYSNYVYADDYTNGPSPFYQLDWDVADSGSRAQSAVSALNQRGRRLTYQKSFLERTPIDINLMQISTDTVQRRRPQSSVLGCRLGRHGGAQAAVQALADDEAVTLTDRSVRRRMSMYHENLI